MFRFFMTLLLWKTLAAAPQIQDLQAEAIGCLITSHHGEERHRHHQVFKGWWNRQWMGTLGSSKAPGSAKSPGELYFSCQARICKYFWIKTQEDMKHDVLLWCLPKNTSHFTQPLDDLCFANFKKTIVEDGKKVMFPGKTKRLCTNVWIPWQQHKHAVGYSW